MGKPNFSDEFKRDAVAQITERGYPVAEVSQRLGVSIHSLYAWKRQFAKIASGDTGKDAEIRQLKRELARVTEECDILKKVTAYFARDAKWWRCCPSSRWRGKTLPLSGQKAFTPIPLFEYFLAFLRECLQEWVLAAKVEV